MINARTARNLMYEAIHDTGCTKLYARSSNDRTKMTEERRLNLASEVDNWTKSTTLRLKLND